MPAHRDEAQSRWQMLEPECSCEAGVPLVLADEILVCFSSSKVTFSLFLPEITPSHILISSHTLKYFLSGSVVTERTVCLKVIQYLIKYDVNE